jgi:CBS-domain-containing membrane protein
MRSVDVDEDGTHGSVECVVANGDEMPRGRVDVAEAAVRVRLSQVLGIDTTCVRADVSIETAREMIVASQARALPVVDAERKLVGILSKSDVLRSAAVRKRRKKTVADVMTRLVQGLPEDAPVAFAISLMAFEGLHEVPVVDADGHVIGMVTSTDALRWVAGALGYVVPTAPRV